MAGHSKWNNIKRKKGAQDKKRAKQFTKAIKEINIAIKEGGDADPETNPTLRNAIANAKGINMPKDNIKRAIKKASGADADNYEEVTFEGYGPHGIAFFVECTTDNLNRTVANVRSLFTKNGGSLGKNGSLEFLFDHKGLFTIPKATIEMELDELELELIESGLESMEIDDEFIRIYTSFNDFGSMSDILQEKDIAVKNSKLVRIPVSTKELPTDEAKTILDLEEQFEDDDDVQNVFLNLKITDELVKEISQDG